MTTFDGSGWLESLSFLRFLDVSPIAIAVQQSYFDKLAANMDHVATYQEQIRCRRLHHRPGRDRSDVPHAASSVCSSNRTACCCTHRLSGSPDAASWCRRCSGTVRSSLDYLAVTVGRDVPAAPTTVSQLRKLPIYVVFVTKTGRKTSSLPAHFISAGKWGNIYFVLELWIYGIAYRSLSSCTASSVTFLTRSQAVARIAEDRIVPHTRL